MGNTEQQPIIKNNALFLLLIASFKSMTKYAKLTLLLLQLIGHGGNGGNVLTVDAQGDICSGTRTSFSAGGLSQGRW